MNRSLEPAGVEQWRQSQGVPQADASRKQMADQFRSIITDRNAQQGVDAEQTGQVRGILGKRRSTTQVGAAENPLGRAKGLLLRLTGRDKSFEHLNEIGAVQRLLNPKYAQGQAPQAGVPMAPSIRPAVA